MNVTVPPLTPDECEEADARALAVCLLYPTHDVRRSEEYLKFLEHEKGLRDFSHRALWWDRYTTIARLLPGNGTHGEDTHDQSRTREAGTVLS